jgi:hypothetical protein
MGIGYDPASGVRRETGESGTIVMILPQVEVRPRSRTWLQSLTVLVPAVLAGTATPVRWRAHASNRHGLASGEVLLGPC